LILPGMMEEPDWTAGEVDLAEAGAGAGGEQAEVVADLGELHGHALEHAGEVHEGAHVLGGFDEVDGGDQGQAGDLGQVAAGGLGVAGGGVQAGADGGGAEVDLVDQQVGFGQAEPVLADGDGVGAEFLAQGHGNGVLELGAAHFDHGAEFQGLWRAGFLEFGQRVEQLPGGEDGAELHRGGVDVVGGLGEVHVVVGVQPGVVALGVAKDFQGAVGDDLVGVHVRRRSGAALDDVHHELVAEFAGQDVLAGLFDGVGAFGVQESEFAVGAGRGKLDGCQATDQVHVAETGWPVMGKFSTARSVCTPQ
jgi:hypothetical protein